MYIGIKNNKVVVVSETPIKKEFYKLDEVKETKEKYMLSDDGKEYIPYNQTEIDKRNIKAQIEEKESLYSMNRWQREIILAEDSKASEYTKQKAQEIEDLAKKIRA